MKKKENVKKKLGKKVWKGLNKKIHCVCGKKFIKKVVYFIDDTEGVNNIDMTENRDSPDPRGHI